MALAKDMKDKVIQNFRINDKDTGSVEVQVALLTERITLLTNHLNNNKQDFSSKRGILKMIGRRRKLLSYLEQSDEKNYKDIIKRLGLKK